MVSNYRASKAINNSLLGLLNPDQAGHPLKFVTVWQNPIEDEGTSSTRLGTVVHKYFEDAAKFAMIATKPNESISNIVELAFRICEMNFNFPSGIDAVTEVLYEASQQLSYGGNWKKETVIKKLEEGGALEYFQFLKTNNEKGLIVLDAATAAQVNGCVKGIKANHRANDLLEAKAVPVRPGGSIDGISVWNELEIYFKLLGEDCKALVDKLIVNHSTKTITIVDLKTTSKAVALFQESFEFYHYYRQMAFYQLAVISYLYDLGISIEAYEITVQIIAVETTGMQCCEVIGISDEWIEKGYTEINSLMDRFRFHQANGDWSMSMESQQNGGIRYLKPPTI